MAVETDDVPPPPGIDHALADAVTRLTAARRLLVASDYDGVLAPIVTDPARAFPLPAGVAVVRALAALPDTAVALISGRARADLAALSGLTAPVHLVGGHGAEFAEESRLTPEQAALRERLVTALDALVQEHPGAWLERKPTSLVVHTRTAPAEVGAAVREAVSNGPGSWPGVRLGTGKEIVELSVVDTHKGTALTALREQTGADAAIFLGDDVTDENAFRELRAGDVGIRVGPGDTQAEFRVPDPQTAVRALELLLDRRSSAGTGGG